MTFITLDPSLPILQQLTIDRGRLFEKLDQAAKYKLTLIAAPPGYGKTTLAAQFARRTTLQVVWHTVDQREQDAPNLFEHSLTALASVVPEILNHEWPAGATIAERVMLVGDYLRDHLDKPVFYILDDVQHLIDSPSAETWLRTLIAGAPSNCHIILIGRALPSIPIAEMIARREVLAIGEDQLMFNFQEVGELAGKMGLTYSTAQVQKLLSRLNGWPAGTLLALQPMSTGLNTLLFNNSQGPEAIFEALAESMLRAQPPALQEFLLRSSTLTRMTPALCQNALRLSNSADLLNEARSRNLFVSHIRGGIIYHALFREFLQRRLLARNPSLYAKLHAGAGQWFENDNKLEDAFNHYIAAAMGERAAAIAERSVHIYYSHGQWETVLGWKTQLDSLGVKVARLSYFCAMLYRDRYAYDQASAAAIEAEDGFHAQGNEAGLVQVALLRATIDSQRGEYRRAIAIAEPFVNRPSVPANLRGYALGIIGTAYIQVGDAEKAVSYLETALPLWRDTGDAFALAYLLINLGTAYLRMGRFDDATACVQKALEIRQALGGTVGIAVALNSLGNHFHLLGDYQQALTTLQEGLTVARRVPENREEGYLLSSLGNLQRDRGAYDEAASLYHRALALTNEREPFVRITVLLELSTLRRWEEKFDEADALALEAAGLAQKHGLLAEQALADAALLAVRVGQGDLETARHALDTLVDGWQHHPSAQFIGIRGICAHAALMANDPVALNRHLHTAIKSAHHPANLQPLVAEIVHTRELRAYVINHASRYSALIDGIARLDGAQIETAPIETAASKAKPTPTYSLSIKTFGQECIERDGVQVPLTAWQAATARGLFYYLLFKGPATKEQIALVFWPDASAEQVRGYFHTTLHRVRGAVGSNVIRFEDDLYSINPEVEIWCDVFEFEAAVRQAQLTSPMLSHTEFLLRRAVELYRGDFLIAFDTEWITAYREQSVQTDLDALLALGNCLRLHGSTQEAIVLYKHALEVDAYREDIHRALLMSYAAAGDRTLVARHVDRLTNLLDADLGITPSVETNALVQSLLN